MGTADDTAAELEVVDAVAAGRCAEAARLVFEYLAATEGEAGHPMPARVDDLPAVLRDECRNIANAYRPPGILLVALLATEAVGCVGLVPATADSTGEVKRLYVRPGYRRRGTASILMQRVHEHAAGQGFTHLVLDVLATRTEAVALYHRLGYVDAGVSTSRGVPMRCLRRARGRPAV